MEYKAKSEFSSRLITKNFNTPIEFNELYETVNRLNYVMRALITTSDKVVRRSVIILKHADPLEVQGFEKIFLGYAFEGKIVDNDILYNPIYKVALSSALMDLSLIKTEVIFEKRNKEEKILTDYTNSKYISHQLHVKNIFENDPASYLKYLNSGISFSDHLESNIKLDNTPEDYGCLVHNRDYEPKEFYELLKKDPNSEKIYNPSLLNNLILLEARNYLNPNLYNPIK